MRPNIPVRVRDFTEARHAPARKRPLPGANARPRKRSDADRGEPAFGIAKAADWPDRGDRPPPSSRRPAENIVEGRRRPTAFPQARPPRRKRRRRAAREWSARFGPERRARCPLARRRRIERRRPAAEAARHGSGGPKPGCGGTGSFAVNARRPPNRSFQRSIASGLKTLFGTSPLSACSTALVAHR